MRTLKRCVNRTVIGRFAAIAIVATLLVSSGIVWLGGANQDSAGIPHLLSYQGVLADQFGDPVPDGAYQMTFRIYENATGNSALWSETRTVQVTDGRFSLLLGNVTPLPPDVFLNGSERWLGVQVESDAEMTPRQRLASVAYAYIAEYTRNLLAPGQGLVIRDADGNVTHWLNANGTSWHAGLETFDGGINVTGPHESPHWTCTITDKGSYYRDENGVLREEVLGDGTHRQWDENGKKRYEALPNGTCRQWDENGTLRRKEDIEGNCWRWDENGMLRYRLYRNCPVATSGWTREYFYDKNGKCRCFAGVEDSFTFKKWYDENETLVRSEVVDSETGKKTVTDGAGNVIRTESINGSSSQTGTHTVHTAGQGTTTVTTDGVEATSSGGDKTAKLSSTNGLVIGSTAGWTTKEDTWDIPPDQHFYTKQYFDQHGRKRIEVEIEETEGIGIKKTTRNFDKDGNLLYERSEDIDSTTLEQIKDGAGTVIRTVYKDGSSSQTGPLTVHTDGKTAKLSPNGLEIESTAGWKVKKTCHAQGVIEEYFDENGIKRVEVSAWEDTPGALPVYTTIYYNQTGNVVKITKSYPNGQTIVTDGAGNVVKTESIDGSSSQTGKHTYQATGSDKRVEIGPGGLSMYDADDGLTVDLSSEIGCAWFYGKGEFSDDVEIDGDLDVWGTKNAVVSTRNYGNRTTYCDESAEVYFFDRGEAHLDGGVVTIELDPIFLETVTIDDTHPMLVQITPTAECNGLYVAQRTASNFTVRELQSGSSDAGFMWEVAAKRMGYEDTRLAEAN